MVSDAQPPLVPPDVDLRDFAFMPLDVVRLRDSDLSASANGEEFRAAVLLWCAAWHQVPAASLPHDDAILSALAGFGRVVKEWLKVKKGALRGWVLCSDGRLYHPVVAEKARDAWESKKKQRDRTAAARAARLSLSAKGATTEDATSPVTSSVTERVTSSKGQGQYKGQGESDKPESSRPTIRAQARSDDELVNLRLKIVQAFEAVNRPAPDTNRCAVWLSQGFRPDVIVAVIAEILQKKPDIRALGYFDGAIADAHKSQAPPDVAPSERTIDLGYAGVQMPEKNLVAAIERWRKNPASWLRNVWGPPPDESAIIRKFAAELGIDLGKVEDAA